jgi:hypothetical protein
MPLQGGPDDRRVGERPLEVAGVEPPVGPGELLVGRGRRSPAGAFEATAETLHDLSELLLRDPERGEDDDLPGFDARGNRPPPLRAAHDPYRQGQNRGGDLKEGQIHHRPLSLSSPNLLHASP